MCGIDVTYCCLGSYNLSAIPPDWKLRLRVEQPPAADNSSTTAAAAAAGLTGAPDNSSSRQAGSPDAFVVALAVVLPVLTVVFVVALFTIRRALRASRQGHGRDGSRGATPAVDSSRTAPNSADVALPLPGHVEMAVASLAAAAAKRCGACRSDELPLLDITQLSDSFAVSPFAQPSWQQQLEAQQSNTATAAEAGGSDLGQLAGSSGSHPHPLVSLWLLRGRTMPADLLARAVDQFHEAQQLQGHDDTAGSAAAAAGGSSSWRPEPPDPPLKR